jgi:hypothetical protein
MSWQGSYTSRLYREQRRKIQELQEANNDLRDYASDLAKENERLWPLVNRRCWLCRILRPATPAPEAGRKEDK